MALTLSKLFMRTISQNPNENQTGISLWTLEDVEKHQAKEEEKQKALGIEAAEHHEEVFDDEEEYWEGGLSDHMLVDILDV
jgi:DNA excision repair protein ERCC-2